MTPDNAMTLVLCAFMAGLVAWCAWLVWGYHREERRWEAERASYEERLASKREALARFGVRPE